MIDQSEVIALVNPKTLFVTKSDIPIKYLSPCCILDLSRLGTE